MNKIIAKLAKRQMQLELEIANRKAELKRISEIDLPDAFDQAGYKKKTSVNDMEITVKDKLIINYEEGFIDWLKEAGHGDKIATVVKFDFPKGEDPFKVVRTLDSLDIVYTSEQKIHGSSLRSIVMKGLAAGVNFPSNLLNTFEYRCSEVKERK